MKAMEKGRRQALAAAALVCALIASLVIAVAPAAAGAPDSAPMRNESEGGLSIGEITGPEAPEEYPFLMHELNSEMRYRQVSDQVVVAEYFDAGIVAAEIDAPLEHDAVGSNVPTSLRLTEGNVITIVVPHRAGNPAAGGAPFVYPIVEGKGWEGGFRTFQVSLSEPEGQLVAANPPAPTETAPNPVCKVPTLRGYSLRGAKNRLRAAHCEIGAARLADGATAAKGKVVRQFRGAGTELAAGAPVAVKLGASASP